MIKKKKQTKSAVARYRQTVLREAVRRGPLQSFAAASLLAALLGFGFYYLVLSDLLASNAASAESVVRKEQENGRGQLIERDEPLFQAEFRRLIDLSDSTEPMMPQATEISGVLAGVQEIARRTGVTLNGLNAVKESAKSNIAYLDQNKQLAVADKLFERECPAQVTGTPAAVVRFFFELARLSRIIVIRDFEMGALRQNFSQANFTLVAFHAAAPLDSSVPALPDFIKKTTPVTGRK